MVRDYPDLFVPEPVDRVAARVISSGQHHEFTKSRNNREYWDIPPDVVPLCYVPDTIKPLIGQRKGSLIVVGFLGRRRSQFGKKRGQILLVRCDCGRYEERVARRWRKNDELDNRCQFCDKREKLKVAHLPNTEKDRLENLERKRKGLPPKEDVAMEKLRRKLVNFYTQGRLRGPRRGLRSR